MKTEAYNKHKERARKVNKQSKLNLYGLSAEEYADIKNHICACCGLKPAAVPDHCHVTGVLRGFLCQGCNVGIGHLGDNEEGLLRALRYLRAVSPHAYNMLKE
jgi:hypothetical protein